MHKITTTKNHEIYRFDTMTEFVDACDAGLYGYGTLKPGFVGERLPTFKAALERTKRDWAEGMYTLQEYVDKLSNEEVPELKSHKRKVKFSSDGGDEIDYDKLMAGQQEFWRTTKREEATGPTTVTVVIDTTTPFHKRSDDILWRGASAIALTKILEEKGYSVEMWLVNGTQLYASESTPVMTACCLKRGSDPLDTSTIINTVAGWFYRTLTFNMLTTICKEQGKRPDGGLGACHTPDQDDLDHLTTDELRVYSSGVFSFDGALSLMRAELGRIAGNDQD